MKRILLVRHAKSSWDLYNDDFDRPLNDRGHKNAPEMAKRLRKKDIEIDAFVSSPAVRALTTAQYFAKAYDVKEKHIITIPALYHASPEIFYTAIEELDDEYKTVAIFSHNPGITEFANAQTNSRVDDMPTCAIFGINADIKHWKDYRQANKTLWFFDYPKAED
jgi:phosphohistidine phosphatase